ncbi:MAG: hypothetical protein GY932_10105 [Arcobacter sp.]|nr:hypothetical protein [Flavobacteriaceae bacterium]MCP4970933.1 hypothetical protein [Arcobacter sp.]
MFFPYLLSFHIFIALAILMFYFHDFNAENGTDFDTSFNIGRIVTVIGAIVSGILTIKSGYDYFKNKKE